MDAAERMEGRRILFQNFCSRAEEREDGTIAVTHVRHEGEFCGLHALGRALHGQLDFDTVFSEIEGRFFLGVDP